MNNLKRYNLFIMTSSFARGIIEIFSPVFLYKLGYDLRCIFLFYFISAISGVFVNVLSIILGKKIGQKNVLIISSFLFGFSYYYLQIMNVNLINLIIFSILYSVGSYTYHSMRHYFALQAIDDANSKNISNMLIFSYVALIFAPYVGGFITNNYGIMSNLIVTIAFSLISVLFLLKLNYKVKKNKLSIITNLKKISKYSVCFFIFEQFKVMLIVIQPLFLYLLVNSNILYIGVFNIFMGLSSVLILYFFVRKIKFKRYYFLLITFLCIVLVFKINIRTESILLVIAFIEGIFIKIYEVISTENIYKIGKKIEVNSYLIIVEIIFCLVRALISLLGILFNNIIVILYICIFGTFLSGIIKHIEAKH